MQSRMSADGAGRVQIACSVAVGKARIVQGVAVVFWTDISRLVARWRWLFCQLGSSVGSTCGDSGLVFVPVFYLPLSALAD